SSLPLNLEGLSYMRAIPLGEYAIHLCPQDNVAVARCLIPAGIELTIPAGSLVVPKQVALGHKLALCDIAKGEAIYKYGQVIGFASKAIVAGEHVHVQNVAADAFARDYAYCSACPPEPLRAERRTFQGYDRGDGRYGTRNYIA